MIRFWSWGRFDVRRSPRTIADALQTDKLFSFAVNDRAGSGRATSPFKLNCSSPASLATLLLSVTLHCDRPDYTVLQKTVYKSVKKIGGKSSSTSFRSRDLRVTILWALRAIPAAPCCSITRVSLFYYLCGGMECLVIVRCVTSATPFVFFP